MKRTLAIIFVFVLCLGLFVGCGSDENKPTDGAASNTANDGIFSTADVKMVDENGESVYQIIRPDGDDDLNMKAAYLYKQIKNKLNINLKNVSDTNDGTDKYEILIGHTNRPESAQARQYLIETAGGRVDDFIVCTIGKKIVIDAMSLEALQAACDYFANNFAKAEGVKGGIKYINVTKGEFIDVSINGAKLGGYVFVKPRFNIGYLVQNSIEEANKLLTEKTGYALQIVEDHNAAVDYEVIVGNAKRDGVTAIANKDEYSIIISGKKVYLNGGSTAATAMAVSEFAKMLCAGAVTDKNSVQNASYTQAVAGYDKSTYYTTAWADDFDEPVGDHETGVDLTKWNWGTDSSEGMNGRTSVRSQKAEHLHVKDGMLNFYAAYDDQNYYGFKLVTKERMTFRYGILEMSAILPHSNGSGFWISLWANSPNRIDDANPSAFFTEVNGVEMFGNSGSEASNLHGWLKGDGKAIYDEIWAPNGLETHWSLDGKYSTYKRYSCPEGRFNDRLHTFTYMWDENTSKFACDGNVYFELDHNEQPHYKECFTQPIYLILSQATCFARQLSGPADDDPVWQESN
ncbi:MAG: family 16 glycosylhydrolase, partial [Clostridia bacterium]|nr:family 16 glycosylhydrolase [Clostridia bacterium]